MAQNCFCFDCTKEQAHSVTACTEQNYQMQVAKMEILAGARSEGNWQHMQCKGSVAESEELSLPGWTEGCENRHQPGWEGAISTEDAAASFSHWKLGNG